MTLHHLTQLLLQLQQRPPVGQDGRVPLQAQAGRQAGGKCTADGQDTAGAGSSAGRYAGRQAGRGECQHVCVEAGGRRQRADAFAGRAGPTPALQHCMPDSQQRCRTRAAPPLARTCASASACLTKERERRSSSAFHSLMMSSTGLPLTSLGACRAAAQSEGAKRRCSELGHGTWRLAGSRRAGGRAARWMRPKQQAAGHAPPFSQAPAGLPQAWQSALLPQERWPPLPLQAHWLPPLPLAPTQRRQSQRQA